MAGEGHGFQVNGIEALTDAFATVGIDDSVRYANVDHPCNAWHGNILLFDQYKCEF